MGWATGVRILAQAGITISSPPSLEPTLASYPIDTGGKTSGVWSWPLTAV